jgi:hypothetical protein
MLQHCMTIPRDHTSAPQGVLHKLCYLRRRWQLTVLLLDLLKELQTFGVSASVKWTSKSVHSSGV